MKLDQQQEKDQRPKKLGDVVALVTYNMIGLLPNQKQKTKKLKQ